MKKMNDKYERTIGILKRSRPALDSSVNIEREVIRRIHASSVHESETFSLFDFLFRWTEIVWIRRSLIAASVMLVTMFVYQQSMIVKKLNWLSNQIVISQESTISKNRTEFVKRLKLSGFSENSINQESNSISPEKLEVLIESMDKLQSDYNDLMKIIQDDPELKELIEKRLIEIKNRKVKL